MKRKIATYFKGASCLTTLIVASITNGGVAHAEGEVSYNAGIVSQYLWRGFDLNAEKLAVQGGADYEHESGLYAGVWASKYDFGDSDDGIEIDIYGGYSLDITDELWLDLSVTSYQYTGESDASLEWKIGLGHEFFEINYHHDQDLDTNYLELNTNYPLNAMWSVNGHIGSNDDGDESYYDYAVFVTYSVAESIEVSGGYSEHEFDEEGAEGAFFLDLHSSF